jgi:hypothetical protein
MQGMKYYYWLQIFKLLHVCGVKQSCISIRGCTLSFCRLVHRDLDIIVIVIMFCLVTDLFSMALLLNHW